MALVEPPTTKQCPACNEAQPLMLETCSCGHEFADIHEAREQLEDRVRAGWAYVAFGGTSLLVCMLFMIEMSGLWILGAGAAGFLVVRGLVTRADARARLSAIQTRGALPSAKVVSQPGKQNV